MLDDAGRVQYESPAGAEVALVHAQTMLSDRARKGPGETDIEYTVRLKPLFGPPDTLYRVVLTILGAVLTHRA